MKKLLLGLLLFVSPLVAMEYEQLVQAHRARGNPYRNPLHSLDCWMRSIVEQRDVTSSEVDEVVAGFLAKNWETFQKATENDCVEEQLLNEQMAQDSESLAANMVKKQIELCLGQNSSYDKDKIMRKLHAEYPSIKFVLESQLERVIKIMSTARKMHVAEQAAKSEGTD